VKAPAFSPAAISFLRALKRNNDREWFKAFRVFAPDLVAHPKRSLDD
jgi:uncharacterized protein (DUF2461 family)